MQHLVIFWNLPPEIPCTRHNALTGLVEATDADAATAAVRQVFPDARFHTCEAVQPLETISPKP